MNELSNGVIRPFNATSEERRGSISEIPVHTWDGRALALTRFHSQEADMRVWIYPALFPCIIGCQTSPSAQLGV
jgi:hypothetical protein